MRDLTVFIVSLTASVLTVTYDAIPSAAATLQMTSNSETADFFTRTWTLTCQNLLCGTNLDVFGTQWQTQLKGSNAGAVQGLGIEISKAQHRIGPHPEDINPNTLFFSKNVPFALGGEPFRSTVRPQQHDHKITGTGKPHRDLFGGKVSGSVVAGIGGGGEATATLTANLELFGTHLSGPAPNTRYSYHQSKGEIKVTIIPIYPEGPGLPREENRRLKAGQHAEGTLPTNAKGVPAIGYQIITRTATDPDPVTTTTLGFIGEINGELNLLDLSSGISIYHPGEFFAPQIESLTSDLFVFVDLVDWLTFPHSFGAGDLFDFAAGRNQNLPGFLVASGPIEFIPGLGLS